MRRKGTQSTVHGPGSPPAALRLVRRAARILVALGLAAGADPARGQSLHPPAFEARPEAPRGAWEAAGPPEVIVTTWGPEDGLPQNTVNAMATTPDGSLWVVTFGGVARFDGLGFEVFDLGRYPELGSNRWINVIAARDGVVLGSESGELVWFDGRERVRPLSLEPRGAVRGGLASDGAGGLWVVASHRLQHWDGERWRSWGPDEGMLGDPVPALMLDRRGRPWFAQWDGVYRVEDGVLRRVVDWEEVGGRTWGLHEDESGRIWLAGEGGLWMLGPDDVPVRVELGEGCAPPFANVASRAGTVWLATPSGVCRLRFDSEAPLRPGVVHVRAPALNQRRWEALHVDAEGNAWLGSSGSGLRRFASARARRWTVETGLRARGVNQLAVDGAGGLWVGMDCAGLMHVGGDGARALGSEETGRIGDCVRSLLPGPDGELWVGMNRGLGRIRSDGSVTSWVRASVGDSAAVALARDASGRVWVAFKGQVGVIGSDDAVDWLEADEGIPGGELVRSLHAAPDGAVWAGTLGAVYRIALGPGGAVQVDTLDGSDGIPPGHIRVIRTDERGRLWLGSYGGGIAVLGGDGPNGRLTTDHGLFDNAISAILEDEASRLWILGNRGVAVVRPEMVDSVLAGLRARIDAVVFDVDEGVPEGNGGSPAAVLDPDGRAWFATIDGVSGFDTRAFPADRTPVAARVSGVASDNREIRSGDVWTVVGAGGDLQFAFSAPSLPAAGATRFRYRLVGYDEHWVDGGAARAARYTSVDGGRYRFEVVARNRDGVWGTEPAATEIRVVPFWWQRGSIRLLLLVTALGLGALLLLQRVRVVEARNLRLERTIRERDEAEERARVHQRELAHVSRVATAGELATSLAHELNQPLMAIVSNAAASDQLLSNPDLGKDVVRDALRDIMSESRRASEVIRSLRRFLEGRMVEYASVRFESVIEDVLGLLRGELREDGVQVRSVVASELPLVRGDAVQLQQVLVNLIMNAVEAMRGATPREARRLDVEARPVDGGLEAVVRDSGPGLDPGAAGKLFDPFYTTKETGMGIGLAISRTLIEAHGGWIEASSGAEGGAEFRVFLPSEAERSAGPAANGEAR